MAKSQRFLFATSSKASHSRRTIGHRHWPVAAVAILAFGQIMSTLGADPAAAQGSPQTIRVRPPEIHADAAYVMDRDTGEALFQRYPTTRRSIASTTKLMTGLIAAESGRLDEEVTVSANAAAVGETSMQAIAGERLSLRELTYGLMLPSGNDAAVAIAESLGGSVAGFSGLMNTRARALGMLDSSFANPHGLDHERFYRPDHFSTAHDMAILGAAVSDNPEIRRIAGTTIHDVQSPQGRPTRTLRNTLAALWWYPGLVAGKTGWTERAGQCRVSVADRAGMRISVALLGSPDDIGELRDLLDYGFAVLQARRSASAVPVIPRRLQDFRSPSIGLVDAWERFWITFVASDGRVQPTGGSPFGTSFLQSEALLNAVWFQDREAFDSLWQWTRANLSRTQQANQTSARDALFASSWANGRVDQWSPDIGADQRIAGALLLASRIWNDDGYATAAKAILAAILEKSAISVARQGVTFDVREPMGPSVVAVSASGVTPAFYRSFAEGARQGVWHWIIDGTYSTLFRAVAPTSVFRRPNLPEGLFPTWWGVGRKDLALSRVPKDGDPLGKPVAQLFAQVAMERQWRREAGASSDTNPDRDDRVEPLLLGAMRALNLAVGSDIPLASRALFASSYSANPATGLRFAPDVDLALRSNEAETVLAGITGKWFLEAGPPDLWRLQLEPPDLPTTRNDAVVPPMAGEPWYHDEKSGHTVRGAIALAVERVGGVEVVGAPLTDFFVDSGVGTQFFANTILVEAPVKGGLANPRAGLGRVLAETHKLLARPEFAPAEPRAGAQFREVTGHTIGGAFLRVHTNLPGLTGMLGDPISEELVFEGQVVQYFEGGRLEFTPGKPGLSGEPVQLTRVGEDEARRRKWLP